MNIKKHIPNFITILNLVCGVFAILLFIKFTFPIEEGLRGVINRSYVLLEYGILLILVATVLDFLDGFAARLLKVQSEIGAQLDSLADMITFGLAPGFLFYAMSNEFYPNSLALKYLFVLIPVFSAIRLAKFNIDEEQTSYFKGLATPANAIFWVGIFYYTLGNHSSVMKFILILSVIIFSVLMISNLRMFSLKLKNLKWEGDNIYRVLLIVGAIVLTILFGLFTNILAAIPFIIVLYILLSVSYHYSTRNIK